MGDPQHLRIAVVAPPWFEVPPEGYGGIEDMVATLVEGLSQAGHAVTLVAAGEDRTAADFVPTFSSTPDGLGGPDALAIELVHAQLTSQRLYHEDVDVIHDHTAVGPLFAPYREAPTVVTVHGPVVGWMRRVYRSLRSVSLVAISEAQRASAPELPWVATVHNAIDVESYPFADRKGDDLVFLGRMHPDKGLPAAIDVARRAGRRLVIAAKCSDRSETTYFEEEIRPLLADDTPYLGNADAAEKRELLEHARALVFPIRWEEPFGLVMIEAMACGTPVIASRRGSVPEVVEHGVTGFICDGIDRMVRAVDEVSSLDPMTIREHALARFDVPVMTRRYEAAYRSVLSERASTRSRQPERG